MPELPEVEVLVRHLRPRVAGKTILAAELRRAKSGRPETPKSFQAKLQGAKITGLRRRAKNLLFDLQPTGSEGPSVLIGHLGMTGRMYVASQPEPLPKHTVATLQFADGWFIFEDPRYFGRLHFDLATLDDLGPEPLDDHFTPETLGQCLAGSRQPVKTRLLDQTAIAGIGNIYASEALWLAQISPKRASGKLSKADLVRLHAAIREVLQEAIIFGSTVPLSFATDGKGDGLFYYGSAPGESTGYEERLRVYDRAGQPCRRCCAPIGRLTQGGRSTYYCGTCQKR